jgi:5'(3')-deoxyribonucleotidase
MDVPTSEVGYTSATSGRGHNEVHKGHVVALDKKIVVLCDKKNPVAPSIFIDDSEEPAAFT